MRFIKSAVAALALACSGCVVSPPVQPVAMAPPPPPQNCREFQQTITVAGKPQKAYGTTCQQPDGSWQVMAQPGQASAAPPPPPPPPVVAYPAYPPYPAYPTYPAYYYPRPYYGYGGLRLGFHGRF